MARGYQKEGLYKIFFFHKYLLSAFYVSVTVLDRVMWNPVVNKCFIWNLDASGRNHKIHKQMHKYIIIDSAVHWMEINWELSFT